MSLLKNHDRTKETDKEKDTMIDQRKTPKIFNNNNYYFTNVQLVKSRQLSPLTPEIERLTAQLNKEEKLKLDKYFKHC